MKRHISLCACILLSVLQSCVIFAPEINSVVTVSFASECCGPNIDGYKALEQFLEQEKKSRGIAISYTDKRWGKEGEFDRCFPMIELNPSQKREFITSLRQKMINYRLVSINESNTCPR